MKNIFYRNKAFLFGAFLLVTAFVSCVKDKELSITEPTRYASLDIKSYADLFKVFWTVMDQQYAFFLEEYQKSGLDWDAVYKEYYPKFEALKTWQKPGVTEEDVNKDTKQAKKYFEDIVDPIIDRHFYVSIVMPFDGKLTKYNFRAGMKNKQTPNINYFTRRYMGKRLTGDTIHNELVLAGNLSSNPDIYYLGLTKFRINENFQINLSGEYLKPSTGNKYLLTSAEIEANAELNAIQDADERNRVKQFSQDLLNEWNSFFNRVEVKTFNDNAGQFRNTEIISDAFVNVTDTLWNALNQLRSYNNEATYSSVLTDETMDYFSWFVNRMKEHAEQAYQLPSFRSAMEQVMTKGSFYKNLLNPLAKGDIKKIIIDVRGNGGGRALDLSYFVSRFVTKQTIYGYQRLKAGNGRFNYTPWTPMYTELHPFGTPSQIPIAVLTDFGSASTSEISTLMLKSQGKHVVSVGDYSRGATAALGRADDFNGGTRDRVAEGYLEFYMPVLALKDQNKMLVEGIGIKPDIYVAPLSDNELLEGRTGLSGFKDRVLDEAIKHLSQQ